MQRHMGTGEFGESSLFLHLEERLPSSRDEKMRADKAYVSSSVHF